jgi:hypothetical protein
MTTARLNKMAVGSLAAAIVGVLGWRFLGGWAALLAATVALVLGFLALGRGDRYGHRARWAAVFGIMFGAIFYAIFILAMARDLFYPVLLR